VARPYSSSLRSVYLTRTRTIAVRACAAVGAMGTSASRYHSRKPFAIRRETAKAGYEGQLRGPNETLADPIRKVSFPPISAFAQARAGAPMSRRSGFQPQASSLFAPYPLPLLRMLNRRRNNRSASAPARCGAAALGAFLRYRLTAAPTLTPARAASAGMASLIDQSRNGRSWRHASAKRPSHQES